MAKLQKPQAILFDWDNTLIHSLSIIHNALEKTFVAMGKTPYSKDETIYRVHRSMREEFPDLFGKDWKKAAEIYQDEIRKNKTATQPIEHGESLLKELRKDPNLFVAVVSNKMGQTLRKEVNELGWNKYFDNIIGAGDAEFDKPSPYPAEMALIGSGLNAKDHNIWFIGDSITDMECAVNSKMVPILYGEHNLQSEIFQMTFKKIKPEHIVHNHQELLKIYKSII